MHEVPLALHRAQFSPEQFKHADLFPSEKVGAKQGVQLPLNYT